MTKLKTITIIIVIIVITVIFLKAPTSAWAVARMESDSYKLKFPNLNMTSGSKSSDNYNILDTVGQTAPGEYASSGFYVKAGFPYIKTIIPFSFTISDLSIDFSDLIPSTFSTLTNTLTVSFGGAGGYSVVASEDHPLQLPGAATNIPDTNCDTSCDEITADVWTNTGKYGFGYHMSGDDIPAAFIDPDPPYLKQFYKQFADESALETSQEVMGSSDVGTNRVATVTYKINISSSQGAGKYENSIMFLATPTY